MNQKNKKTSAANAGKKKSHRFGGRATASGVNYEVRIAAYIAVKMLSGSQCTVWGGVSGADVSAITLQAPENVDDIVVELHADASERVFISAKDRSEPIALTAKSPAFTDVVDSFVSQFLQLSAADQKKCRFIWAIPSSAGQSASHWLPTVVDTYRLNAIDTPLSEFLCGRRPKEKSALTALVSIAKESWKKLRGSSPADEEMGCFLRQVYVEIFDFESGHRHDERLAEDNIRSHVVDNPHDAPQAWKTLEHFFNKVDQRGLRVTPASLRHVLTSDGLKLKSPPDYAEDITRLRELTTHNLAHLKEHTILLFGRKTVDAVYIQRIDELDSLFSAVQAGHLLITGEPGCGKSGIIHPLIECMQAEEFPVVLLLAEEVFGRDWKGAANLPGLSHALDEVLANWPDGLKGFIITDALDAVRDVETQKMLRRLLRDVKEGKSGWTVVASVREFDLKYGRELRESFPGDGVADHKSEDFSGVAHFYLTGLSEAQLDELSDKRPEIRPFVESARKSHKSSAIHHSPFYLRLAAELLKDGVAPARLADWNSPAVLLRKFWDARIEDGDGADERVTALTAICRQMVTTRSMALSTKEISLGARELRALREIRSRGILQGPALRHGTRIGDEEIRFTHHLLHDYAIARVLIPTVGERFSQFAIREPLLPIFYRQSFMFALEELWDVDDSRESYWKTTLQLESMTNLHGLVRILAPILAARRVETIGDLQSLLTSVGATSDSDSPAQKALRHLAAGLQDASPDSISAGAAGWCTFTEQLAKLLPSMACVEGPLVQILARLIAVGVAQNNLQQLALNVAGRVLLSHHIQKEVSQGWRYAANIAIETLCRTFNVAPIKSEEAFLALLGPERLTQFPHNNLFDLANNIKHLGPEGDAVVLRLFEAAFADEPERGKWEELGTAILPMRFQSSDQWNSIHYLLAEYYEANTKLNVALLTEAACIAWNAVVRRRAGPKNKDLPVVSTIRFRGVDCPLVEDYSHIGGREFEHEENRILSHYEKLLREWATNGDTARLNTALEHFAIRNRTSLMWTVFMEAGAENPLTLGILLGEVLQEQVFLTHQDYAYGGTELLGALHKAGGTAQRESLENFILALPRKVRLPRGQRRTPTPSWVEYAQNRLLGALEEPNLVLKAVRDLWHERQKEKVFPENFKQEGPRVTSHSLSDQELIERRGISLKDPVNEEMFRLREELKPFVGRNGNKFDMSFVERNWSVIQQCERALRRHGKQQPEMAKELWGHLVGACGNIAAHASWPKTDERWLAVRRILLKATGDPLLHGDEHEDKNDNHCPSCGWPAPRLDAARGLLFIPKHLCHADRSMTSALRRLCSDKSSALRFNLAERLSVLYQPAPALMWKLVDIFVAHERKFSVLDALLLSLDRLSDNEPEKVMERLRQIADRARRSAPADNHIHEKLAKMYLFRFLHTGDPQCEAYINILIDECDGQLASKALAAQLHGCLLGGWMTAGDNDKPDVQAETYRGRTWNFFSKLLTAAQTKLQQHRDTLRQLYQHGRPDTAIEEPVNEKINCTFSLVNGIAMRLYFASGAFNEKPNKEKIDHTTAQMQRFWQESSPLFSSLVMEMHPHTAYHIIQALFRLLPCAPREVFLLAAKSIMRSASASVGFQHDSLAVGEVVKIIQRALADYREIFQSEAGQESESLSALLEVLDLFVEAGWPEARLLTHRLEEIYR